MKYVFDKLKYNRFQLEVFLDNKAAAHVYKKMGLKIEGIRRKYAFNKVTKRLEDEAIMSILRGEWLEKKRRLTKKLY
jgi:RimJ/RimL family protein N-acetyltransferase